MAYTGFSTLPGVLPAGSRATLEGRVEKAPARRVFARGPRLLGKSLPSKAWRTDHKKRWSALVCPRANTHHEESWESLISSRPPLRLNRYECSCLRLG